MDNGLLSQLGGWVVAVIVAFLGWVSNYRANRAQEEQVEINAAQQIQDAYQGVLGELRIEIKRLSDQRKKDILRWREEEASLLDKIRDLEIQLRQEIKERKRLEARLRGSNHD